MINGNPQHTRLRIKVAWLLRHDTYKTPWIRECTLCDGECMIWLSFYDSLHPKETAYSV